MKDGWCEFDGTPESCTRLADWFGGHDAGVARWRTTTYDGGWLLNPDGSDGEPFGPGDTIFRKDGAYRVEHGPGWDARIDAILVDRVMRSMRLRAEVDAQLVKKAKREGLSINEAVEAAVLAWVGKAQPSKRQQAKAVPGKQVQPRFKGKS